MSRRCELTGKGPLVGNNVSHANNKTKRIYRPNLQTIALASEVLGNSYKLKISMNALRSVDRNGGLDPFLLKCQGQRVVAQGAAPEARDRQKGGRKGGLTINSWPPQGSMTVRLPKRPRISVNG